MPHRFIIYIKVQFFERHVLELQSITQPIGNYETSIISNIALLNEARPNKADPTQVESCEVWQREV